MYQGSYIQERIWFNDAFEREVLSGEGPAYFNIPLIFEIDGLLNVNYIKKTLKTLLEKHEVLRTYLLMKDEELTQDIQNNLEPVLEIQDWSNDNKTREAAIAFLKEMNAKAFQAGIGAQLSKSFYLKLNHEISFFMFTIHHGICDDVSKDIIKKDIINFYTAVENNEEPKAEEVPLQYADFSEWQKELSDEILESQVMYWKRKLKNGVQPLVLPSVREKVGNYIYNPGEYNISLPQRLIAKVNQLHIQYGFEKRDIFLAIFKILLMKYSGEKEIYIGISITKRINDDLLDTVGPISNLATLSEELDEESIFIEVIKQVNQTYQEAAEHSIIPFDRLVTDINPKSKMSATAFFDILFNYVQNEKEIITSKFKEIEVNLGWGKYDYNLLIKENESETKLYLTYNAFYYSESMAKQLVHSFMELSEGLLENPQKAIYDVTHVCEDEKDLLLHQWTKTNVEHLSQKCVHDIFSQQTKEYPDQIAVQNDKEYITYRELENSSNQIANWFKLQGVEKEDIIAIIMDRNINTIELLFGILKVGACYLTIEPDAPIERMQYILEDSRPKFLIIEECYKEKGTDHGNIIILESLVNEKASMDTEFISTCNNDNLAYIMYTSGTTGKPKGVLIEHRNLVRIILHSQSLFNFTTDDVWSLFHSYSFDLSVWEIFGALLTGGKVVVVSRKVAKDMTQFRRSLIEYGVTVLTQTPTAFNALVNEEIIHKENKLKIRYIIFAGEALRVQNLIQWREKYAETMLINMYGITETTIHVTFKKVTDEEIRTNVDSIGVPLPNYQIYVLDTKQKIVPIGVKGEIYVGGSGVAREYLNKPELTAEKFIKNPFGEGILYRSGDLARWQPNGELEYLGRMDDQIKIRGFRIELGEIENVIKRQDGIQNAAVIAREKDGEKYICAYLVSENKISISTLRDLLEKNLPEYMIPSYMMQIEKIPITGNGKLDKKALPQIEAKGEKEYVAPRNEIEKEIVKVFEEILGVEKLGIKDSFYELGGDSIKAIRVISKLRELNFELTIKDIMQMRVIENILTKIRENVNVVEYEQGEVAGEVPLTPIQHTFFKWNLSTPNHFNLSVMLKSRHRFEEEALREVLRTLVVHHDMLRAIFKNGKQEIRRSTHEQNLFTLEKFDFRDADEKTLKEWVHEKSSKIQSSIDISNGPLMKVALYQTSKCDHLMICIHHLVVDGISLRILLEDFVTGYDQYVAEKQIVLPKKTAPYSKWSKALLEYSRSEMIESEIGYWNKISEAMKTGKIESDADGTEQGYGNTTIVFSEDKTRELLYEAGKAFNTEINDLLLAALGISIKSWKGQRKVALHMEGHGREEIDKAIDINRTVGWFTSIYPIIIETSGKIENVIIQTKEMLRHIPNHGMGYGVIQYCEYGTLKTSADLCFNYLGVLDNELKADMDIRISELFCGRNSAVDNKLNNSISINGSVIDGKLIMTIEYDKCKYSEQSIRKFSGDYESALNKVIEICTSKKESVKTASDYYEGLTDDVLKDIMNNF